jgi:hypothetical protein
MGFIAHEVQSLFPFLVNHVKDGENMQSINYNGFIALLVKEVQSLKGELKETQDNLKKTTDTLKRVTDFLYAFGYPPQR